MRFGLLVLAALLVTSPLMADDGAASVAAGGLVLMKREPRIVMAKEVLRIAPNKVIVDYDFRNDSDEDITTTVAFPVPAYRFGEDETVAGDPAFKNFELAVDGKPKQFAVQVQALLGHRDITSASQEATLISRLSATSTRRAPTIHNLYLTTCVLTHRPRNASPL